MFDIDRWNEILASIRSNKLRTFLSGFTIALALFVFITLFGLSKGLQNGFQKEFFSSNAKSAYIYSGITNLPFRGKQKGRKIELKMNDYNYLINKYGDKIKQSSPSITRSVNARYKNERGDYVLMGVLPTQQALKEHEVISGRYITDQDGATLQKNVVIGRLVEKDLFKNESAIGKNIQLGKNLYQVVGVFADNNDGDDEERKIYLPIQTIQVIYGTVAIDKIDYTPSENLSLEEIRTLSEEIETQLKSRHLISPADSRGLRVWDSTDGLKTTDLFFYIFTIIVFVIGGGSLIAGIVSISNMMAYSVRERTKEIGVRKALGATPANIIALILQETLTITFLFGFIGIGAGMLLTYSLKNSLNDYLIYNPTVENSAIIMATLILFLAGILAGFLPARKAALIKPIEALRRE